MLLGMQGVRSSSLLGSIPKAQALPRFFSAWRTLCRGSGTPWITQIPLFGAQFGARLVAPKTACSCGFSGPTGAFGARLAHGTPAAEVFETLRLQIRREHGKGWSMREIGATNRNPIGRCQLIRIWEDRTRSSVVLPLKWQSNQQTAILTAVGQLRTPMEERNLSLQDANKLNTELLAGAQQNAEEEFAGWPEVGARFLKTQEGRRSSTLRDLTTRVERTLKTLKSKSAPRDGFSVMRRYAEKFFDGCPPGGVGRKRNLLDVARCSTCCSSTTSASIAACSAIRTPACRRI